MIGSLTTFALLTGMSAAFAQPASSTSKRPLTFVAGVGSGTGVDLLVRAFAERLRAVTGSTTVVENKPGANGAIGATAFLSLPADGNAVLAVTSNQMVLTPLTQKLSYKTTQLRPILAFSRHTGIFVTATDSGYKTLADVVEASKSMPGGMNIGTYSLHFLLAMRAFEKQSGAKLNNVSYKSIDAFGGLIDGSVPVVLGDLGTSGKFIATGKVRPLAAASDKRNPLFPDVPTVAEAGYPGYEVYEFAGFVVNADTPEPIVKNLEALFLQIAADPEYLKAASRVPGAVLTATRGEDFDRMLSVRREQQRALLESLGGLVQ